MFAHYSLTLDFFRHEEKIVGNRGNSANITYMRNFKSSALKNIGQTFFAVKPVMGKFWIEMSFELEEHHAKIFDPIMHRGGEDEITSNFQYPVNLIEKNVGVRDVFDYFAGPNGIKTPIIVRDFFLAISHDKINARDAASGVVNEFRQDFDAMRFVSETLQFGTKGASLAANIQNRLPGLQAVDKIQGALET